MPLETRAGIPLRAAPCFRGHRAPARRPQLDARAARLGQPDGNRLFGGARPVLALADMVDFLPDEFPGLG